MTNSISTIHIVLVRPEIHWNTGNAGRTCLAAGAQLHLVEPLGFSLAERQVRRAGLDYWSHVRPRVWPDWATFARELPALGEPYLFSIKAQKVFWDVAFANPAVLIFGSETHGLPDDVRQQFADRLVTVPMRPDSVRCLNLSTSVGIAVYEVLRQHRTSVS